MPKPRSTTNSSDVQPFSLILEPAELGILRKLARKEGTSMGVIVRRAIGVVIEQVYPQRRKLMVEHEAEEFLRSLSQRYPSSFLTSAKRSQFKRQVVRLLA